MSSFEGTATWLRGQWSNPNDIFTILLIIGGDIIQVAIAQLCAGPIPYFTPVSFSFGWVTYAVSALLSAIGENQLMPKPELECKVINAESGYSRTNHSWILSRMLRDLEFWQPKECEQVKEGKLRELREGNKDVRPEHVRIGLRVTVWECKSTSGKGSGDMVYWMGIFISMLQLGIAAIPWAVHRDEWFTFLVTAGGTILAYASGALPQWVDEKTSVKRLRRAQGILLTEGNGADDAILIFANKGDIDLENLAAPRRGLVRPNLTRMLSVLLAVSWVALLLTVSGWQQHTWYLVGVGMIGMLHNVVVAGAKRHPTAWGIDIEYKQTIVEAKVMQVLMRVEEDYPRSGASLVPEFFPGVLFPREQKIWAYAKRRCIAWEKNGSPRYSNGTARSWPMPPLYSPPGAEEDNDIPENGEYTGKIPQSGQSEG